MQVRARSAIVLLGLAIGCAEFLAVPPTTAIAAGISQSDPSAGEYVLLSKKGGTWFYRVSWEIEEKGLLPKPARKETGTLSILNEGETSYEGLTATRFSWVYGGNISYQVTLLVSSPAGILTVGSEMRRGTAAIRERFEPPVAEGGVWDHAGKRIQAGGRAMEYTVRNEYVKHERVTSPAASSTLSGSSGGRLRGVLGLNGGPRRRIDQARGIHRLLTVDRRTHRLLSPWRAAWHIARSGNSTRGKGGIALDGQA